MVRRPGALPAAHEAVAAKPRDERAQQRGKVESRPGKRLRGARIALPGAVRNGLHGQRLAVSPLNRAGGDVVLRDAALIGHVPQGERRTALRVHANPAPAHEREAQARTQHHAAGRGHVLRHAVARLALTPPPTPLTGCKRKLPRYVPPMSFVRHAVSLGAKD